MSPSPRLRIRLTFCALLAATLCQGPTSVCAESAHSVPLLDTEPLCSAPTLAASTGATGVQAANRWDFFTNFGRYMPRAHCLRTATGEPDWFWVWSLVVLNVGVIAGYGVIVTFWIRCYLQERKRDRNPKLMDLAMIFLFCATCGYGMSTIIFFWPAYRLLAILLLGLNVFTWKFVSNLEPFRKAFTSARVERELTQSLWRQNTELEAARKEAESANAAKSEFLAKMSHELRSPMNAILGFSEMLQADDVDVPLRVECATTIRRSGEHLLDLINDILDLSKIEAGEMDVAFGPTDVRQVCEELCRLFEPQAARRQVELSLTVDSQVPPLVQTDERRLKQTLTNLVSNAIKFTLQGAVRVRVEPAGQADRLQFLVIDTGVGIAADQLTRIFEPFAQVDSSHSRENAGTGLGLSIAQRLSEMLDGELTADSEPGIGSTFRLTISAVPAGAQTSEAEGQTTPLESDSFIESSSRHRILFVDDSAINRRLTGVQLRDTGWVVETASNGREGLDLAMAAWKRGYPYDVVIMDMQMPVMDGYEAARQLRDAGYDGAILALTANAMAGDAECCIAAGCDAYRSKPILKDSLVEAVERLLSEGTLKVKPDIAGREDSMPVEPRR